MGGAKNTNLNASTGRSKAALITEDQRAQELKDTLSNTRQNAATNASTADTKLQNPSSGFDPNQVADLNKRFQTTGAIGGDLAATKPVSGADITDSSFGRGRETFQNFADTGGISPEDQAAYYRGASRAATAGYAANKDELNRRLAIQGGYMPGYTSGAAALDRNAANSAAEARTNAQSNLAQIIAANRLKGAQGLADTRTASGNEALKKQQQIIAAKTAGGNLANEGALGESNLATNVATGNRQAGQQLLDYYKTNLATMTDADKLQIENRLAQLGYTKADIDANLGAASQRASGLQTFTQTLGALGQLGQGVGAAATGIG